MSAAAWNIDIEQGATWRPPLLTWLDAERHPVDLTGAHALMQLRSSPGGRMFAEIKDGDGITLGGEAGTLELVLTADQTMRINADNGVYDLVIATAGGDVVRLVSGKVRVTLAVSVPST